MESSKNTLPTYPDCDVRVDESPVPNSIYTSGGTLVRILRDGLWYDVPRGVSTSLPSEEFTQEEALQYTRDHLIRDGAMYLTLWEPVDKYLSKDQSHHYSDKQYESFKRVQGYERE